MALVARHELGAVRAWSAFGSSPGVEDGKLERLHHFKAGSSALAIDPLDGILPIAAMPRQKDHGVAHPADLPDADENRQHLPASCSSLADARRRTSQITSAAPAPESGIGSRPTMYKMPSSARCRCRRSKMRSYCRQRTADG
eukprot:scaffold1169_cov245-Pinguiococcus_pyrenoidosus.AAC.3